jgi:RND family efflux transporter MFP subunit
MHKSVPSLQENGTLVVALELLAQLNLETKHLPAAMTFCNELAFHFKCGRVALGYLRDDLIETVAFSNATKFERRLEMVRDLENTMQEAADQDSDVYWPAPMELPVIMREHERYVRRAAVQSVCSLPLRADDHVRGVVTLIRDDRPFNAAEVDALRVIVDLATRRLLDLDRYGNQWWRPYAFQGRELLARFLGPRHTWIKATVIGAAIAAIVLFLIPFPYRVTGEATLKTEALANLSAPFDGFIKDIHVIPGDQVTANQPLLELDPTELKLKQQEALANMQHFQSQAQLANGQEDVTQMHVYEAQANEAQSQLQENKLNLNRATLSSPFAGVVADGDLKDKIGSPVKQGDVLIKVTRLEDIFIEAEVSEEDIQDVREGADGEARLVSRPADIFPLKLTRLEPAAFATAGGNVFRVRCKFECPPASWWRPGMTGVVRLSSGHRSLWYIVTHRAIDFLRLKFWF